MIRRSATIPLQYDTSVSPFYVKEFDEALVWLNENEFDGIELCIAEPAKVNDRELVLKLNRLNLKVPTISTGQSRALEGISLTDESKGKRDMATQRIKEHIHLATSIGCPFVTIGLIRGTADNENKIKALDLLQKELEICLQYAIQQGVSLLIEPINRYETSLINSCEEALDFINRMYGCANIGILYDTFHSNMEDRDMQQAIESSRDRIFHVHLADSNRWLPGEGHINFNGIIGLLQKLEYKGFVSLETSNLPDRNFIKQNAFKSLNNIL